MILILFAVDVEADRGLSRWIDARNPLWASSC